MTESGSAHADDRPETRLDRWIASVIEDFDDAGQDPHVRLFENFQYLVDHTDEVTAGAFDQSDLPHFDRGVKEVVYKSALFGSRLHAAGATLYVLVGPERRFVGLYGRQAHADDRAADADELSVLEVSPECPDPAEYEAPRFDSPEGTLAHELGACLRYIATNRDDVFDRLESGDFDVGELPAEKMDDDVRGALVYSVVFGMAWDACYPDLALVLDGERFCELHFGIERARRRADRLGPGHHAQRVSVSDGDLDPEDLLPEFPNLPEGDDAE